MVPTLQIKIYSIAIDFKNRQNSFFHSSFINFYFLFSCRFLFSFLLEENVMHKLGDNNE